MSVKISGVETDRNGISILYTNESTLLVKTSYIPVRTSHANVIHLNVDGLPFPVKRVRKFGSAFGGEVTSRCARTHVCM